MLPMITRKIPVTRLCAYFASAARDLFPEFLSPITVPSHGGRMSARQPTTQLCSRRSHAWHFSRLRLTVRLAQLESRCTTAITSASMATTRITDRKRSEMTVLLPVFESGDLKHTIGRGCRECLCARFIVRGTYGC